MKPKQLAKPPAPPSAPDAVKKLGSKPSASRNKAQVDTLLRAKKKGQQQAIADKTTAARGTRSPAAMIAALHDIRPLGHQLATSDAGKGAWDKTIDGAVRAWEAVHMPPGKLPVTGPAQSESPTDGGDKSGGKGSGGFPASTKGGGNGATLGFPDVCKVPAPPAPFAPVPCPNPKTIEAAKQAGADVGPAAADAADAAGGAAGDAADAAHDAADAVQDAAGDAADAAQDAAAAGGDAAQDAAGNAQDAGTNTANTVSSWLHH